MFIGHFAPALVVAARPKAAGLGTLFVAAQLVDIGFAVLLVLVQAIDWFGPKEPAYSLAVPATMLFAYALLAGTAAWAGANRRPRIAGAMP